MRYILNPKRLTRDCVFSLWQEGTDAAICPSSWDIPWKGYTDMPQTTGPLNFSLRSKGSDFQGTYFLFLACKYLINRSRVVTTSFQ